MTVTIIADGRPLKTEEGRSVLEVCLANGIYIPNLCHMEGMADPPASCRLCFVEVEGTAAPVTACTLRATDGMVIRTDTPEVRRLQRTAFRLLLSVHHVDCKNCPANRSCELQRLAVFLKTGLKNKALATHLKPLVVDDSHPFMDYYPNRCVLCGRCIHACRTGLGHPLFDFAGRGFNTVVSFYGSQTVDGIGCETCSACAAVCPVGALQVKAT